MGHIALYRAWRPQAFRDMVGQQHIVQTLQNAIREERLSHAYLFSGPRGTGKTSAAKILAKAVNCERGPAPEPCNECVACRGITAGTVMDVVEIDAASNRGVEEIRDIRDKVKYAPTEVRRKVYIIDEVHMLTTEAFNALLKTLEEPPRHVMFVLATTEPHRLPPTIVSRCQRFEFRRLSAEEQKARLRDICRHEGIEADDEALAYIARLSDGGMRDAISLLDQIASFTDGRLTLRDAVEITGGLPGDQFARLAAAIRDADAKGVLQEVDALMRAGKSPERCLELLIRDFRDMLLLRLAPETAPEGHAVGEEELRKLAEAFSVDRLFAIIETLNRYLVDMKYAANPQAMFEIALLRLCTDAGDAATSAPAGAVSDEELRALRQRVADLERKLDALMRGGHASGPTSGSGHGSGGVPPGGSRAAPAGGPIAGPAAGPGQAAGSAGGPAGGTAARPDRPPAGAEAADRAARARARLRLEPFLAAMDSPETQEVKANWHEVLERLRKVNVSLRAWLVNGEPVSFADGTVLVAFRNAIHRETTEKPANRQAIEDVMSAVLGRPVRLATLLQKEWHDAVSRKAAEGAAEGADPSREELRLVPDDEPGEPPWVEEAVKMFGESLVVIEDD